MVPTYNNFAELSALLLMLKCVVSTNVSHLQIFCDSLLFINWIRNLFLSLYDHIKQIETQLVFVSYSHVYRELNMQDDSLSKEALIFYSSIVVEVENRADEKLPTVWRPIYAHSFVLDYAVVHGDLEVISSPVYATIHGYFEVISSPSFKIPVLI